MAVGQARAAQTVLATLDMAGPQHTEVSAFNGGTPEASLAVRIGRSLLYLHTEAAASRLADVWHEAKADALLLPAKVPAGSWRGPVWVGRDAAEASVVVHTVGVPAAASQLIRPRHPQQSIRLSISVGSIRYLLADQIAFAGCAAAFARATEQAAQELWRVDARYFSWQAQPPSLAGSQADRAREEFTGESPPFRWFGPDTAAGVAAAAAARRAAGAGTTGGRASAAPVPPPRQPHHDAAVAPPLRSGRSQIRRTRT